MLSEIEFSDKKHIIMDKFNSTIVMQKTPDGQWDVISLPKNCFMLVNMTYECMSEDEAYEYYKERMESYGYRTFPVLME